MPALYLVATPIGNLEDVTLRALRVLKEAGLIAAEDTRTTRKLLSHYDIHTPLTSYHQHNKRAKLDYLLARLQEKDVALVSEAGTPGLSDPGYEIVLACLDKGISVVSIPGPSAITAAVTLAGLANNQFLYLGFLPRRKGERQRLLEKIALLPFTLVFLEAPHRLKDSLLALKESLGDRKVAICRELTKLHEEVFRGSLSQALDHFAQPKGEFTLVIEGHPEAKKEITPDIIGELQRLRQKGVPAREAIAQVAQAEGLSRRELYRLWLELKAEI